MNRSTPIQVAVTAVAPPHRTVVGLDVLRLLAALMVVCYHFFFFSWVEPRGDGGISDAIAAHLQFPASVPYTSWGWIGVDLFFVISGFVITMSARGKTAAEFAVGRFSRLFPALLFFASLTLAVVIGSGMLPPGVALTRWLRAVTLFPKGPWIDGVIWTLTIEAIFYGLIFLSLWQGRDRIPFYSRLALIGACIFWAAIFLAHAFGLHGHAVLAIEKVAAAYWARVILLSTGPFFLLGIFAYEALERGITRLRAACIGAAFFSCLIAIYTSAINAEGVTMFHQSPFIPMLVWAGFIGICGLAVWGEQQRAPGKRVRNLARRLGLMTYPLYLVHDIAGGWVLGHLFRAGMNRWLAAGLTILLAMAVSYLFAITIEPRLKRLIGINLLAGWMRSRGRIGLLPSAPAPAPAPAHVFVRTR